MAGEAHNRPPLDRFRSFETTDVDEARYTVGRHFCSHRLDRASSDGRFDACQNRVPGQHVSLNYIRYGADVTIEPGELTDFFLVQMPLRGSAEIANGRQSVLSTPQLASLLNPDRHTKMRWHAGCEQVLLQIERGFLQAVAERMAGMALARVRFEAGLDLRRPAVAGWSSRIRSLVKAAEAGDAFDCRQEHHQSLLEEALVASLLTCQANTASAVLERRDPVTRPAVLKRAVALIRERLHEDIGLLDISAHAGTTPRNLQLLFKREYGTGPVQLLHDMRLSYARHLLLTEGSKRSIADISEASGHRHFGRFSVGYKKRFGESPKDTRNANPYG
eukprot:g1970.t1